VFVCTAPITYSSDRVIDDNVRVRLAELLVAGPRVGGEQADLIRHNLAGELVRGLLADVLKHARTKRCPCGLRRR
jgi:hypothetical protein